MCGISGCFGKFEPGLVDAMNAAQVYRGPDGKGSFVGPGIALGHVRLAILDLSEAAAQPMRSSDGRYVLTFNGEIYNFKELREDLEARGHRFVSTGDTEVLLRGLMEFGYRFVEKLNGIFAFALWDGLERELFLARDGLGVKPLYYSTVPSGFLFASELKALLACREVRRDLDKRALHYHLAYLWCPAPDTVLEAVKKVEPGEAIIVRGGRIARRWYFYDLPYGKPPLEGTERSLSSELSVKVESAVRRQLVADVRVGAFLSGGLDSSSIAAMMHKINPDEAARCYSIGFGDERDVEGNPADLPYARKVALHLGADLQVLEVRPDMIRHLGRMLFHLDEPQADPAPINALLIAERARADGVKVLMSGAGGDDVFSGYRRHWALQRERLWSWLPRSCKRKLATFAGRAMDGDVHGAWATRTLARRAAKLFAYADLPDDERLISYFYWSTDGLRRSLYAPALAAELENVETAEPLLRSLSRIPGEPGRLNRMLYLEGKHFLADHNLNYTDKVSMAAGVEVRVPLVDVDLVEYAARIPMNLKQKGGIGKSIFKKAMEAYLPREVIYRKKSGFGAPLRRWLRHELRPIVDDVLSQPSLRKRGLFDPAAVSRLIELDRCGRVDGAYTIFSLLCTEMWCRMFVDVPVPQLRS